VANFSCHPLKFYFNGLALKLQSAVFPLCRHLCSKSAIAVISRIIDFACVVLQHPRHGTVWMNTMFEESVQLLVTAPVWILQRVNLLSLVIVVWTFLDPP